VLDDATVWEISLPNDWLGGIKGQDLLAQTLGSDAKGGFREWRIPDRAGEDGDPVEGVMGRFLGFFFGGAGGVTGSCVMLLKMGDGV